MERDGVQVRWRIAAAAGELLHIQVAAGPAGNAPGVARARLFAVRSAR